VNPEETAQVVDIETTLKAMEGLINAVAETNDKRYQLLLQIVEDLRKRVEALETRLFDLQTEALAKASAEIVKSLCGSKGVRSND
jgi:Glu-tRNA(Gln) amidotransferase subunit E-like FAD-binding protein